VTKKISETVFFFGNFGNSGIFFSGKFPENFRKFPPVRRSLQPGKPHFPRFFWGDFGDIFPEKKNPGKFPGNFREFSGGIFRAKIAILFRNLRDATALKSKKPPKFFDKKTEKLEKKMLVQTLIRPASDPHPTLIFRKIFVVVFSKKNAKKTTQIHDFSAKKKKIFCVF